jgi:predicted component of type VI protein secretion system
VITKNTSGALLADLTGRDRTRLPSLRSRSFQAAVGAEPQGLIDSARPRLDCRVHNRLSDDDFLLAARLDITTMGDFTREAMMASIPAALALRDKRDEAERYRAQLEATGRLDEMSRDQLSPQESEQMADAPSEAIWSSKRPLLDSVVGQSEGRLPPVEMRSLRDQVVLLLRASGAAAAIRYLHATSVGLTDRLSSQMDEVVNHQHYVSLAGTWQYLSDELRADRSRPLLILNVSDDELREDLEDLHSSHVLQLLAAAGLGLPQDERPLLTTIEHALPDPMIRVLSKWGTANGIVFRIGSPPPVARD